MPDSGRPTLPNGVVAQHALLASLINDMKSRIAAGASWDEIAAAIDRTRKVVRAHFDIEEEMMERNGYPKLATHRSQHAAFLRKLDTLATECKRRETELLGVLIELLESWFSSHEKNADQEAMAYMNE